MAGGATTRGGRGWSVITRVWTAVLGWWRIIAIIVPLARTCVVEPLFLHVHVIADRTTDQPARHATRQSAGVVVQLMSDNRARRCAYQCAGRSMVVRRGTGRGASRVQAQHRGENNNLAWRAHDVSLRRLVMNPVKMMTATVLPEPTQGRRRHQGPQTPILVAKQFPAHNMNVA